MSEWEVYFRDRRGPRTRYYDTAAEAHRAAHLLRFLGCDVWVLERDGRIHRLFERVA